MANETNHSWFMMNESSHRQANGSGYPLVFMTFTRVNSLVIFIENVIVSVCLFVHKNKFSKREFWLHLVSLNMSDVCVGIACFWGSFINYDTFRNNIIGCALLFVILVVSQLTLLYNVLSICIYRWLFLVSSDRLRFSWKPKMTIIQIVGVYLFSTVYAIMPLLFWGRKDQQINTCSQESMFGSETRKLSVFLGIGFLFPLVILNVLYCVTFYIIRRQCAKKYSPVTKICFESGHVLADQKRCHRQPETVYKSQRNMSAACNKPLSHTKALPVSCQAKLTTGHVSGIYCNVESKLNKHGENMVNLELDHIQHVKCDGAEDKGASKKEIYYTGRRMRRSCSDQSTSCSDQSGRRFDQSRIRLGQSRSRFDQSRSRLRDSQKQSLVLIGVILLLIDITILPSIVVLVASIIIPSWTVPVIVMYIVGVIAMNNSLINPWVYALQSKEFKEALKNDILHSQCLKTFNLSSLRDRIFKDK